MESNKSKINIIRTDLNQFNLSFSNTNVYSNMRHILFCIFILLANFLTAQKIPFFVASFNNNTAIDSAVTSLAGQLILHYKSTSKARFYSNSFHYNLAAKKYRDAQLYLDSLRSFYNAGISTEYDSYGIEYESFFRTKEKMKTSTDDFDRLYPETLRYLYEKLPPDAKPFAGSYLKEDTAAAKMQFETVLQKIIHNNKDSIDISSAGELCIAYNTYTVFAGIKNHAEKVIAEYEERNYIILDNLLIPGAGGAQLSAVVVRKKSAWEPQPVVLVYTIYAGDFDKAMAMEAADNGFTGIVVNTRGKKQSPQAIEPFEHDAKDAWFVIDWISKQKWCNGKVGMYGGSYLGFSQWSAVKKVHPALKTIVPQASVGIGIDYPQHNGIFLSYMLRWIHTVADNKVTATADIMSNERWDSVYTKWYQSGKSYRSLDTLEGRPNAIFQKWLKHPSYDSFWHNMVPHKEEFKNIHIPILTITGYYDDDQRGAMFYFNQHTFYNKKANHYLVIGPYSHGGAIGTPSAVLAGYKIDPAAKINITKLVYQWMNHVLKDSVKPVRIKDKINYQVMGTNAWQYAPSVAAMSNDTLSFYFSNVPYREHYLLQNKKQVKREYITQKIDYKDRGTNAKRYINDGLKIIDTVIQKGESISFISEPVKESFYINGSFFGDIRININKKDVDLYVNLYEQLQDGTYFLLSNYITRASYAKDKSKRQLLVPGKDESVLINNSDFTGKLIKKGNRLIVVVGMYKRKDWQVNYGTGKDVSDETIEDGKTPLLIKWINSSVIQLPVKKLKE
jgi:uncharacterized protein